MSSGHLEVETKYDVDDGFVVPELAGLDGVASVDPPVEHHARGRLLRHRRISGCCGRG